MPNDRMTQEECVATLHQVMLLAGLVRQLDVEGLRRSMDFAHSVGPILDPTGYQEILYGNAGNNRKKLEGIRRVIDAACEFKTKAGKALESIPPEAREALEVGNRG